MSLTYCIKCEPSITAYACSDGASRPATWLVRVNVAAACRAGRSAGGCEVGVAACCALSNEAPAVRKRVTGIKVLRVMNERSYARPFDVSRGPWGTVGELLSLSG